MADITYVATEEGPLYLAAIKGLWNRETVGCAVGYRMTQDLVGRALFRAVAAKRHPEAMIHHSDRESQYCSHSYKKLMKLQDCPVDEPQRELLGQRLDGEFLRHTQE